MEIVRILIGLTVAAVVVSVAYVIAKIAIGCIDRWLFKRAMMFKFYQRWLGRRRMAEQDYKEFSVYGSHLAGAWHVQSLIIDEAKHIRDRDSWLTARRVEADRMDKRGNSAAATELRSFLEQMEPWYDEQVADWCMGESTKGGCFIDLPFRARSSNDRTA